MDINAYMNGIVTATLGVAVTSSIEPMFNDEMGVGYLWSFEPTQPLKSCQMDEFDALIDGWTQNGSLPDHLNHFWLHGQRWIIGDVGDGNAAYYEQPMAHVWVRMLKES